MFHNTVRSHATLVGQTLKPLDYWACTSYTTHLEEDYLNGRETSDARLLPRHLWSLYKPANCRDFLINYVFMIKLTC